MIEEKTKQKVMVRLYAISMNSTNKKAKTRKANKLLECFIALENE